MEIKTLPNGLTVIFEKKNSNSVAIEVNVKTGSCNEPRKLAGVSHFLEHLLFTGTNKRKDAIAISREIDRIGGEFNAATSHERTFYYTVVPKKHFNIGVEVLADMMQNTIFNDSFEKERDVILKEISFTNDNPRSYQWLLFYKALFEKHPAKFPIYGNIKTIKNMEKEWVIDYYKKHYIPNNMSIAVVGDVNNPFDKIKKEFTFSPGKLPKQEKIDEPLQKKPKLVTETRKTEDSYMVFGYKVPSRSNPHSYSLDVIKAILGGGMSSRLFEEIRIKRGLSYGVAAQHDSNVGFGTFAIILNAHKDKKDIIKDIIIKEIKNLKNLDEKGLEEAKTYIEGNYLLENESNSNRASTLNGWHMVKDARDAEEYISKIKNVKKEDITEAADIYLNENYTFAVLQQSK